MATVLTCTRCEHELKPHCHDGHCDWYTCRNRKCPARIYDIVRGIRPPRGRHPRADGHHVNDRDPWRCRGCGAQFAVPSLARHHERTCPAVPRS